MPRCEARGRSCGHECRFAGPHVVGERLGQFGRHGRPDCHGGSSIGAVICVVPPGQKRACPWFRPSYQRVAFVDPPMEPKQLQMPRNERQNLSLERVPIDRGVGLASTCHDREAMETWEVRHKGRTQGPQGLRDLRLVFLASQAAGVDRCDQGLPSDARREDVIVVEGHPRDARLKREGPTILR